MINPLQEVHDIIERMLFKIGDEQLAVPDQVALVVATGDQAVRYLIQTGTPTTTILTTIINVEAEEEEGEE